MKKNKILALKYRPQKFEDLIGQDVISKTITNAIKVNKTPNAYLLTGIRGVGKTTTARLIAKALNCEKNQEGDVVCTSQNVCGSCSEIIESNHIDVLEMDAASKTGIDDIRDLIENSKYSPTTAKYKIFIIDEVHMLSKQAFNGLLKTLEEPPPSLKFVLATTEVNKIPVTILSRCQRFDLKRVNVDEIFKHIKNISKIEKGKITDEALRVISQASEGSVRDAISLLDRALIYQGLNHSDDIQDKDVRDMLGIVDKSKIINLIELTFKGKASEANKLFNNLYNEGLDAKSFLNNILEVLSLINRKICLGKIDTDKNIPETDVNLINEISKDIGIEDIGLFWQFTIKTLEDLKVAGDERIALEMYIMQLMYLKSANLDIEEYSNENSVSENLLKKEKKTIKEDDNNNSNLKIKSQLKSIDQLKTSEINSPKLESQKKYEIIEKFEDIVKLANNENEIDLKFDLERNVKLVNFSKGKIDISFNEKLNKNFIKNLTEKLALWTNERWIISLSKNEGEKTLFEKKSDSKKTEMSQIKNNESVKNLLSSFSDASLVDVEKIED